MLAPVQAYCSYYWDSGLRDLVIARWDDQKKSHLSADEDDPTADSIDTPSSASHIPINFKLKIAREAYNALSTEEKKKIDERREKERDKPYTATAEIEDNEERDEKLRLHQK
jgi:hypothetical protein